MPLSQSSSAFLASGTTTLCRCWYLVRRDGRTFAFTDHDGPVEFDRTRFRPTEAVTAQALEQTTGLAVDNSEILGALADQGMTEDDIRAGLFDGARVEIWLVDWTDPTSRLLQFRGEIGEIERAGGAFKAELRGLTEMLNQPQGRLYQRPCRAILGDRECGIDLDDQRYSLEVTLQRDPDGAILTLPQIDRDEGWFDGGRLLIQDGVCRGLFRVIKADRKRAAGRHLELWDPLPSEVGAGTRIVIKAGCDKAAGTCRRKFDNIKNFRGFPFLPSEDWLYAYPKSGDGS